MSDVVRAPKLDDVNEVIALVQGMHGITDDGGAQANVLIAAAAWTCRAYCSDREAVMKLFAHLYDSANPT